MTAGTEFGVGFAEAAERLIDTVLMADARRREAAAGGDYFSPAVVDVYGAEYAQELGMAMAVAAFRVTAESASVSGGPSVAEVVHEVGAVVGAAILIEMQAAARLVQALADRLSVATDTPSNDILRELLAGARMTQTRDPSEGESA